MFSNMKTMTNSVESLDLEYINKVYPFIRVSLVEDCEKFRESKFDLNQHSLAHLDDDLKFASFRSSYSMNDPLIDVLIPINVEDFIEDGFNLFTIDVRKNLYQAYNYNLHDFVRGILCEVEVNEYVNIIEYLAIIAITKIFQIDARDYRRFNSDLEDKIYYYNLSFMKKQDMQISINRKALERYDENIFSRVTLQDRIFKQLSIKHFVNNNQEDLKYSSNSKIFPNLGLIFASLIFSNLSIDSFEFKNTVQYI